MNPMFSNSSQIFYCFELNLIRTQLDANNNDILNLLLNSRFMGLAICENLLKSTHVRSNRIPKREVTQYYSCYIQQCIVRVSKRSKLE